MTVNLFGIQKGIQQLEILINIMIHLKNDEISLLHETSCIIQNIPLSQWFILDRIKNQAIKRTWKANSCQYKSYQGFPLRPILSVVVCLYSVLRRTKQSSVSGCLTSTMTLTTSTDVSTSNRFRRRSSTRSTSEKNRRSLIDLERRALPQAEYPKRNLATDKPETEWKQIVF